MTRKDYELIAEALLLACPSDVLPAHFASNDTRASEAYCLGKRHAWINTCKVMCDRLVLTNELFDRDRFLAACGVGA